MNELYFGLYDSIEFSIKSPGRYGNEMMVSGGNTLNWENDIGTGERI